MGTRKALIPLTALAVLGTACGTTAPLQKAPEDVVHDVYYTGAGLKFEGDIDGKHVRRYEQLDAGHTDIFLEVFSEDGTVIVYGNDFGPSWRADPTIEWVAIPAEDEIRLYENNRITLVTERGKTRLDFHLGIGEPVLKEAQAQYDKFMAVIDGFDEQREQEYYETTLLPLQEWALERLVAPEPVLPTPEPVVDEPVEAEPVEPAPEPVDVEPREAHQFLQENYLGRSELVWQEQTGRALVRTYEDVYEYATYLVVDQADGTSLFFSDWRDDQDLDAFAITLGGQTVFYEHARMLVFKDGEEQEILQRWPPENVWAEARNMFGHYLPRAKQEQQKTEELSAEEMENWALGELGED